MDCRDRARLQPPDVHRNGIALEQTQRRDLQTCAIVGVGRSNREESTTQRPSRKAVTGVRFASEPPLAVRVECATGPWTQVVPLSRSNTSRGASGLGRRVRPYEYQKASRKKPWLGGRDEVRTLALARENLVEPLNCSGDRGHIVRDPPGDTN